MLPVYMLVYLLVLTPRWPNPLEAVGAGLRRVRVPTVIGVAFVLYASVVWYVTSDAINHLTIVDALTKEVLHPQ